MSKKTSLNQLYSDWQRQFVGDALADDSVEIRRHIAYLELNCTPATMLEGTDMLMIACLVYGQMDNKDCESFIKLQRYRLCGPDLPTYCLTFDLVKGHYGRILTDQAMSHIDFADLFNHPWEQYKTAGFHEVYISRLDGEAIEEDEMAVIERRFVEDMFYDYTDDELSAYISTTELEDTVLATAVENEL